MRPGERRAGAAAPAPLYAYDTFTSGADEYAGLTPAPIVVDGAHPFSIAAWIEPLELGESMPLVTVRETHDTFALGLTRADASGQVRLYAACRGWHASPLAVPLGGWHYAIATYQPATRGGGTLELYLDGAPAGSFAVEAGNALPAEEGAVVIGGSAYCRLLAVDFWSACLTEPEDLLPALAPPTPSATLQASVDFTQVPAVDRSGHDRTIGYADFSEVTAVAPSMQFGGSSGCVAPAAEDRLSPGGSSAPFTVQAWAFLDPPALPDELQPPAVVLANGDVGGPAGLAAYLARQPDGSFAWTVRLGGAEATPVVASVPVATSTWHNLAATFDGETLALYVDGAPAGSAPVASVPPLTQPQVLIGAAPDAAGPAGTSHQFTGALQAVGIWTVACSPAQVAAAMTSEPAAEAEGLAAYFDLAVANPFNRVTGSFGTVLGDAGLAAIVAEWLPSATEPVVRTRSAGPGSAAGPTLGPPSAAWLARVDAEVEARGEALLAEPTVARGMAEVRALLELVPQQLRARFEREAERNLRRGAAARAAGIPIPGTFTYAVEGEEVVFSAWTEDGLVEVGRSPRAELDDCTAWLVAVACTAVAMLLALLGVAVALNALRRSLMRILFANERLVSAMVRDLMREVSGMTVTKLVATLAAAGQIPTIVVAALAGVSWWSWAWTVASVVMRILGIWVTGGWYLAWLVVQLGLDIAQFAIVVERKPRGCFTSTAAAPRLA